MNHDLDSFPPPDATQQHKAGGLPVLAVLGIVLALVFPLGGLVCAVVLFARGEIGPGLAVVCACLVGGFAFLALNG